MVRTYWKEFNKRGTPASYSKFSVRKDVIFLFHDEEDHEGHEEGGNDL